MYLSVLYCPVIRICSALCSKPFPDYPIPVNLQLKQSKSSRDKTTYRRVGFRRFDALLMEDIVLLTIGSMLLMVFGFAQTWDIWSDKQQMPPHPWYYRQRRVKCERIMRPPIKVTNNKVLEAFNSDGYVICKGAADTDSIEEAINNKPVCHFLAATGSDFKCIMCQHIVHSVIEKSAIDRSPQ
ncbi:hypothetical protein ACJ73_06585 [Blastomyces percursus]|uniref:Uncharacterized protein n=1 Tax=Blastomyces percursus TaxID=1658174 RepID=A0A1J9Q0H9_9EURO|nr:hypothetical protein ACJ73_06585 [Blastomyces percursus]